MAKPIEIVSIVHPVGISICVGLFALSTWRVTKIEARSGWKAYAIWSLVVAVPLLLMVADILWNWGHLNLGPAIVVVFIAGPWLGSWLLGLPVGGLLRLVRARAANSAR